MNTSIHEAELNETIAERLAQFVVSLRFEDLPKMVVDEVKRLVLDQFACELMGSTLPWVAPAVQLVRLSQGVKPESRVANHGFRLLAADAAFANATFGQACEMDDSNLSHIGTATIPVALAVGERENIDGRQFITAIIAGYEVMYRLMDAVRPYHDARGFHSQSIAGPFASAAVTGKLLNLSLEQMVHALAIAGSHACGPIEYDQSGGEVKRIHAGLAARGGVHSALLAQFGLTGPKTIIEGKRGFCQIFAERSNPSVIAHGLGENFNILNTQYKMYPTVGGIHTAISATQRLRREHDIKSADVKRIHIAVAEHVLLHGAGIRRPHDVISAQFSLAFSIALALIKGENRLEDYMNPKLWRDPEITQIIDKVETSAHPDAHGELHRLAKVSITLSDGRWVETNEPYAKGSPKNPASGNEMSSKVISLAGTVLAPDRIDKLIESVDGLEKIENIKTLADHLVDA